MKLAIIALAGSMILLASCAKDNNITDATTDNSTVALKISVNNIPQSAIDYINTNFSGYTIDSAYQETRCDSTIVNVVSISNGTTHLELAFDANWNFIKVETDADRGPHHGGEGRGRGHHGRGGPGSLDSLISNSDIGQAAIDYINTNYAGATIEKAYMEKRPGGVSYDVIILKDSTRLVLEFDSNWAFVKVEDGKGKGHHGRGGWVRNHEPVASGDIPQSVKDYVAANYAGYTLDGAFKETEKGVVTYDVLISNGTLRMVLEFDSSWNFVKVEKPR